MYGYIIGIMQQGAVLNSFTPPDDLDISDNGYTSLQIDEYLIYHAANIDTLNPARNDMDIRGNDNPTSASKSASEELTSKGVDIFINQGFKYE